VKRLKKCHCAVQKEFDKIHLDRKPDMSNALDFKDNPKILKP